ncbi:MAG: 4-oxalocrotonate tautomerase [Gemmatimonadetes bacterium]|nr:4-oxalocrotonate tautomerase [Gemmatimonadota bacterium]|tara:strand:+ start:846 stop:1100 length:255 start_codon:yes stop_codon:yes gene_type:complete
MIATPCPQSKTTDINPHGQKGKSMPFVTVKMLDGRTPEQKRRLVSAITDAVVEICGAKPEGTMVVIEDIARDHWSRGGVMISDR